VCVCFLLVDVRALSLQDCRRVNLLKYFGERSQASGCRRMCDVCKDPDGIQRQHMAEKATAAAAATSSSSSRSGRKPRQPRKPRVRSAKRGGASTTSTRTLRRTRGKPKALPLVAGTGPGDWVSPRSRSTSHGFGSSSGSGSGSGSASGSSAATAASRRPSFTTAAKFAKTCQAAGSLHEEEPRATTGRRGVKRRSGGGKTKTKTKKEEEAGGCSGQPTLSAFFTNTAVKRARKM